jgi:perosamine synthetase
MDIPLARPFLGDEEIRAVEKVIGSRRLATGETVRELEAALAQRFQQKYCVAVNSGTTAVSLGLKVLGIKHVIIPVITCKAVLYAALQAGSEVIFADVEQETHNIDLSTLSADQLSNAEAVIITHTYGHAVDMDKLDRFITERDLLLVEDFSQATGGYYKDKILGSFGKIAITSFYATKGISAGYGGALFTNDEDIYLRCMYARGSQVLEQYDDLIPMNYQMTDIQAAIGLVQFKKLDEMNNMRCDVADKYTRNLNASPVGLIIRKEWAKHTYYKYVIVLPEGIDKRVFIKGMNNSGIAAGVLYDPPLHKTEIAMKMVRQKTELPIAEYLAPRAVSLPMFPELSDEDIDKVCMTVKNVIGDSQGRD